jgi:integrase
MPCPKKHPKTGIYQFRRAVPKDLKDKLGWEIKVSLGTSVPAEAKRLYAAELEKSEVLFDEARSGFTLSDKNAKALAGQWLVQALDADEKAREFGEPDDEKLSYSEISGPYEIHLDRMSDARDSGKLESMVHQEVDALIRDEGLPAPKGSEGYQRLAKHVFWAKVKYYQVLTSRSEGDWSPVDGMDQFPDYVSPAAIRPVTKKSSLSGKGGGLVEIYQSYKAEKDPSAKTKAEFDKSIRRFIELRGDVQAIVIDKPMVREFKNALVKLPPSLSGELRKMTMPQVLEAIQDTPDMRRLSAGSVNKQIGALSAVLAWADRNGYFDVNPNWSNPTIGMKVEGRKNDSDSRLPYDDEDLKMIFSFPVFTENQRPRGGAGEAAKWLPLLALFSGAREEEIGQLLVSDIGKEGDVWYFDINTRDEGKRVKTRASRRKVPLHPEVLQCGFLNYVDERSRSSNPRLFPDLKPDKLGQLTGLWSRWWGRYARKNGVTDRRKVFHSFRHTFKTACRACRVPKAINDTFTGHTSGDVGDEYGSGYPLSVLGEEMTKLEYRGLDLSHLYNG